MKRLKKIIPVLVLPVCLAGCRSQEACEKPQEVINTFFGSIEYWDLETAYNLLDKQNRAALKKRAKEIKDKTGKSLKPHELIVPQRFEKKGEIQKIESEKGKEGDIKSVVIRFKDGSSARFPLSKEGNCYKVHLDI